MQNKELSFVTMFLLLFLFQDASFGEDQILPVQDIDKSILYKKVKSPALSPIKKEIPGATIPMMESIAETGNNTPISAQDELQNKNVPQMTLIKTDIEPLCVKSKSEESQNNKNEQKKKLSKNSATNEDCMQVTRLKKEKSQADQLENEGLKADVLQNSAMGDEVEAKSAMVLAMSNKKLSIDVENTTGKTVYVSCFAYIKKRALGKWRWDKSSVYELKDNQKARLYTDEIEDKEDRSNVFGYLGLFDNREEAENSTFELLSDRKKIDLDLIEQLKDKTVRLEIEKYGFHGNFYDYDFVKSKGKLMVKIPELDFSVINKTGKPVLATCFVYEKKAKGSWLARKTTELWGSVIESRDDMSVWRFDKTPVIRINPDESGLIDVDTIVEPRDREYVRGYLVLFDEDEQKMAEASTYELLPSNAHKIDLGRLANLKNKSVTVYTESYGTSHFIDYTVQSAKRVDLTKITKNIR